MSNHKQSLIAPFANAAIAQKVEEQMNRNVKYRDLPAVLARAMEPTQRMIAGVATAQTRTDLSFYALASLLIEKGVFTQEEFDAKEAQVTQEFQEAVRASQSPAQQEAQALAGDRPVQRLTEPVGENALPMVCGNGCACADGACAVQAPSFAEENIDRRRLNG